MTQMRKFEQEAIAKEILDTIRVSNYTETKVRNKNRKHFLKKTLPIGDKIKIVAELHDEDTRKKGLREKVLDLNDYHKKPSILGTARIIIYYRKGSNRTI